MGVVALEVPVDSPTRLGRETLFLSASHAEQRTEEEAVPLGHNGASDIRRQPAAVVPPASIIRRNCLRGSSGRALTQGCRDQALAIALAGGSGF